MAQGCKKVNNNKNGMFRYEMIGKTQPEIELLEVVVFIYPFSLKEGIAIPSVARIWFFNTVSLDFLCSFKIFFKNPDRYLTLSIY